MLMLLLGSSRSLASPVSLAHLAFSSAILSQGILCQSYSKKTKFSSPLLLYYMSLPFLGLTSSDCPLQPLPLFSASDQSLLGSQSLPCEFLLPTQSLLLLFSSNEISLAFLAFLIDQSLLMVL
jgi:hypothetical protein